MTPLFSIVVITLVPCLLALPNGPPLSACTSMQPHTRMGVLGLEGHLAKPQNDIPTLGNKKVPNYYISHNGNATYMTKQMYTVTIGAHQNVETGTNRYKGVLMQARKLVCADNFTVEVEDEPIGTFTLIGGMADTLLKTLDCAELTRSAVSHKSPQYKISERVTWTAPNGFVGHIIFKATVVKEANEYWTNLYSPILKDPSLGNPPRCGSPGLFVSSYILLCFTILSYFVSQ